MRRAINHLKMRKHPERLLKLLIKENGEFKKASWDRVMDMVAEKLDELRKNNPTTALLYISEFGRIQVYLKKQIKGFSMLLVE